jgi:hypothetical protein
MAGVLLVTVADGDAAVVMGRWRHRGNPRLAAQGSQSGNAEAVGDFGLLHVYDDRTARVTRSPRLDKWQPPRIAR